MNALNTRQTGRMAGVAALIGTLFSLGGTLSLAEHYAYAGRAAQSELAGTAAQAPGSQHAQFVRTAAQS